MTDNHGDHNVSMWEDPEESSALRQLLRAGRVENSDYDVDSGLARHLAQLQAGAQLPAWATQTTLQKSASWSLLAWLVPPAISAGVVGAWLAFQPAAPLPAAVAPKAPALQLVEPARPSQTAAAASVATAPEATKASPARPVEAKRVVEERDVAEPRIVRSTTSGTASARALSTRRTRTGRSDAASNPISTDGYAAVAASSGRDTNSQVAGAGTAVVSAKSANDAALAKPVSPAAQQLEPMPADEAKAKPAAERHAQDDKAADKDDEVSGARLEREMRMLAVAQRVLNEDPERSLRLCRQGETEFRGSMFSAERKQIALLALVQLGKVEQARREGIPFLRAFPNAPWSARLRQALSTGKLPSP